MAVTRSEGLALGLAGGFALLMPLALIATVGGGRTAPPPSPPAPLVVPAVPPLAALYQRPMFAAAAADEEIVPADAPALVGIAGRLGADAVALVRTSEGTTRTLRIGESVDGWQLASLAIDAAFFTRGASRVRVPLPVEE